MSLIHRIFGRFCSIRSCRSGSSWIERRIGSRLELDSSQRAKLAAVAQQLRMAKENMRSGRDEGRSELLQLFSADTLDRDAAKGLLHQQLNKLDGHSQGLVDSFAEFFDSLGDHQRQRLRLHAEKRSGCCHC